MLHLWVNKDIKMKQFPFWATAILLTSLLSLFSCKRNKYAVNTDEVNLNMDFRRLDRDLFPAEKASTDALLANIKQKYPDFYREYFAGVVMLGNPDGEEFNIPLAGFSGDLYINQLVDEINKNYAQTEDLEKEITNAFKRYHHYLPKATVPRVVFCLTALNYAVVATDSVLAVGLDMFLGGDFPPYKALQYPEYITRRKDRKHIIPEVLQGWLLSEFPKDPNKISMIDLMVYQGKIMFMLGVMLPDYNDTVLFGYPEESTRFIQQNEGQIWGYLLQNKLLFSDDKREISKIMEEAPFTAGMPKEVPGRIGMWVGRNIIKSYLENNSEITLEKLMADNDYKNIFTKSKYKPKK